MMPYGVLCVLIIVLSITSRRHLLIISTNSRQNYRRCIIYQPKVFRLCPLMKWTLLFTMK